MATMDTTRREREIYARFVQARLKADQAYRARTDPALAAWEGLTSWLTPTLREIERRHDQGLTEARARYEGSVRDARTALDQAMAERPFDRFPIEAEAYRRASGEAQGVLWEEVAALQEACNRESQAARDAVRPALAEFERIRDKAEGERRLAILQAKQERDDALLDLEAVS